MNRFFKIFHTTLTIISWTMLAVSLVYLLTIWNSLPEVLGVHFAPGGEFDVYDNKLYIAYPYGVGFGLLFLLELAGYVAKRVKSGLKITKAGERKLKSAVYISAVGIITLIIAVVVIRIKNRELS